MFGLTYERLVSFFLYTEVRATISCSKPQKNRTRKKLQNKSRHGRWHCCSFISFGKSSFKQKAAAATRRWHNANNPDRSTLMWLIKLLPQLKFLRGVQILPEVSSVTLKPSRRTSRSRLAIVLSWTSQSSGRKTHEPEPETSAVPHWVEQAAPSGSSI